MSDNYSVEPFLNDLVSDADGTKRNLRFSNVSNPIDGYQVSDTEMVALDGTNYYGYLNPDGKWYIMKEVVTNSGLSRAYTYAAGDSGYNWSNRAAETYASYDSTF